MGRRAPIPRCSTVDRSILEEWADGGTDDARLVERARIITGCLSGLPVGKIAGQLNIRPNTVIFWRKRFEREGIDGLRDRPRCGKPRKYDESFRDRLLRALERPPPEGRAKWDGNTLASCLGVSCHAVWRILRKEGIYLSRQRSWRVSTNPQFRKKMIELVGLYLDPPENALVWSVAEDWSRSRSGRTRGYVCTGDGKFVQALGNSCQLHGELDLLTALAAATEPLAGYSTAVKRRDGFGAFMEDLLADSPAECEIHVLVEKRNTGMMGAGMRRDEWTAAGPRVIIHCASTSEGWLEMAGMWLEIFACSTGRGSDCVSRIYGAVAAFAEAYGENAVPFAWRKHYRRERQRKNTIVNLSK